MNIYFFSVKSIFLKTISFFREIDVFFSKFIPGSPSTSICTLTGHSGPVTGVLLALPLALSAAGCTVRVCVCLHFCLLLLSLFTFFVYKFF